MWALRALCLGTAVCAVSLFTAQAQEKKAAPAGAVTGKVKSVDVERNTLTIATADGKTRTFTVTDSTTMVGPRGGQVRQRLKDPRFHEGLEVTVVASGNTAKEVQLGYDRKPKEEQPVKAPAKDKTAPTPTPRPTPKEKPEADEEFTGKVKSVDVEKRLLVLSLQDGKDRSFILAAATPVKVKGATTKGGLSDPAVKAGASVKVVTEPGGRKVKEVIVTSAPAKKKAG